ncbi:MAG: MBL fold metallo-hydrolase [Clostridia bacterium]
MQICNLSSGSKGNCTFIRGGNTSVLVDDGLSLKELNNRAQAFDIPLDKLSGIIVTHEHIDHIKGVDVLARKYNIPIFIHTESLAATTEKAIPRAQVAEQNLDVDFCIGDLEVSSFRLPHDSAHNLGFQISDGKSQMAIATDTGWVSDFALSKLINKKMVIIESNHDEEMLRRGCYPFALKQRILGKNGHLSNDDCAKVLRQIVESGCETVMLAHLSQDNNTPELAFDCAKRALQSCDIVEGRDVEIDVASQWRPSRKIEI